MRDQDTRPHANGDAGVSFNVVGGPGVPASNAQLNPRPHIMCHKCGKTGHFSGKCAEAKHVNGTVLVVTETEQAPDAVSVLGPKRRSPAVTMTLLGSDMANSVCSFDSQQHGITFIQPVAKVKERCTARACKQAVVARKLQDVVGRPSTRDCVKIVEGGMLPNCPITRADISAAEDICGPNMGSLKGKTVHCKNMHVPSLVADVICDMMSPCGLTSCQ